MCPKSSVLKGKQRHGSLYHGMKYLKVQISLPNKLKAASWWISTANGIVHSTAFANKVEGLLPSPSFQVANQHSPPCSLGSLSRGFGPGYQLAAETPNHKTVM